MKMAKCGQITTPKAIRYRHKLLPGTEVEVKLENGTVTVRPKPDMKDFDAAVKKWCGSGAKRLRNLGFNSTDEFIEAIRGR